MTTVPLSALSDRIGRVLALEPAAHALEFEHRWHTWGELSVTADAIACHVGVGERVAVLLRNRPAQNARSPAARSTTACTAGSSFTLRHTLRISSHIARLNALSASGRFSVIVATLSEDVS